MNVTSRQISIYMEKLDKLIDILGNKAQTRFTNEEKERLGLALTESDDTLKNTGSTYLRY